MRRSPIFAYPPSLLKPVLKYHEIMNTIKGQIWLVTAIICAGCNDRKQDIADGEWDPLEIWRRQTIRQGSYSQCESRKVAKCGDCFHETWVLSPVKNTEHQTGRQGSYFLPKTWNCCIVATCAHILKSVVAKMKWKWVCQKVVCSDQTKIPLSKHGWRTSECPDKKIGWLYKTKFPVRSWWYELWKTRKDLARSECFEKPFGSGGKTGGGMTLSHRLHS